MSYEFAKKEIGDYRITIYQDEDAECPCTEWDLVGVYFWDYSDYGYNRELSRGCSREVDAKNAEDALKDLVCNYVSQKKIIDYINNEVEKRPKVLYGIENIHTGEITFNARGGAYQDKNAAYRKMAELGVKEYRLVEYKLESKGE